MDLRAKGSQLAAAITKRPWLYKPIMKVVNGSAWLIGLLLSPWTLIKDREEK